MASLCDNEFFHCLMFPGSIPPIEITLNSLSMTARDIVTRARDLNCLQPSLALMSDVNFDGEMIDFSSGTFLGLPNPLEFEVVAGRWTVSRD